MNRIMTGTLTAATMLLITAGPMAQAGQPGPGTPPDIEGGGVATVGPVAGPGECTFDNLQEAMESPIGFEEIHVHVDYDADNGGESGYQLIFADIRGGLQDCFTGEMSGRTTLNVDGNGRIFQLSGGILEQHITLRDLNLVNGSVEGNGGGIYISGEPGNHSLTLENVRVSSNTAISPDGGNTLSRGGGLYVEPTGGGESLSDPLLIMDNDSIIQSNEADLGGGLACYTEEQLHPRQSLVRLGTVPILQNHANDFGGGIYAEACPGVTVYAGSGIFAVDSIALNSSDGNGGGISARTFGTSPQGAHIRITSGAYGEGIGDAETAAQIVSNSSVGDGGGIHITGGDSRVTLQDTLVSGNSADFRGEAAFVSAGTLRMEGTRETPCEPYDFGDLTPCSRLRSHTIDTEDRPIIQSSGQVQIYRTYIEGNEGDGPIVLNEGLAELESVLARDNDVASIVRAWQQDAEVDVRWSTFSGNETSSALVDTITPMDGTADLRVLGSILWDPGNQVVSLEGDGNEMALAQCLISHQSIFDSGFTHHIAHSGETDPRFVDTHEGDYRLEEISPAIDYCDPDEEDKPELPDLDGSTRGIEAGTEPAEPPSSPQPGGIYDLGAFEFSQLLFRDRFEAN